MPLWRCHGRTFARLENDGNDGGCETPPEKSTTRAIPWKDYTAARMHPLALILVGRHGHGADIGNYRFHVPCVHVGRSHVALLHLDTMVSQ